MAKDKTLKLTTREIRLAQAGSFLLAGDSMKRALVKAGFSESTARAPKRNGLSADQCLEALKRQDNGTYLKKSLPPLEFEYSEATIQDKVEDVDENYIENLPRGLDGAQYQWADIDGEGLSGILTEQGDSWFYKRNVSAFPVIDEDGFILVDSLTG